MLNWLIFGCFQKCDEPRVYVGFNFGLNVFILRFVRLMTLNKKLNKKTKIAYYKYAGEGTVSLHTMCGRSPDGIGCDHW